MMNRSLLFFFLVLLTQLARAQDSKFEEYYIGEYKFKTRNNWVQFGLGPNFYPNLYKLTNSNLNIDYNFYTKSDRLFQVGYTANSRFYLFDGGKIYLHDFHFGMGKRIEKQYWKAAIFVGPSVVYSGFFPLDSAKTFRGDKSLGVGIRIQPQLILKPVYDFGISFAPFVTINTVQSVAGLSICIYGSNAMVRKIR